MKSRTGLYQTTVEFGDCDPAQIAFYPNFFRWYDASTRHFFEQCGVPPWRELERSMGIIGTPVVETQSRYRLPANYGDRIHIVTWIEEWKTRSFIVRHAVYRDDDLLAEGREVRIFAIRHPDDTSRIQAVGIPTSVRTQCDRAYTDDSVGK